jgi:hypothetical protein
MVNSLQVGFARSGAANATVGLIAQGEAKQAATLDASPSTRDLIRFNQFQGSIKQGGAALGNVVSAQLTYSNNLERIETIRSDGKIDGADPTVASLTGNLEVRFADTTLIDADRRLTFIAHEVYLPKPKLSISGPGGIQATFEWQAAKAAGVARMFTVELVNDVISY